MAEKNLDQYLGLAYPVQIYFSNLFVQFAPNLNPP
jgi:hypothetical protein